MVQGYFADCTLFHWLGFVGALIYVCSFAAVQFELISGNSMAFPMARLIASHFVMFGLIAEFNLAAFVLNTTYFFISLFGIVRLVGRQIHQDGRGLSAALLPTVGRI